MEKKILQLKINNKDKDFENYLRPQWSWKTLVTIGIFSFVLVFVVKDLEIDFIKLVTDSSKYFGDILSRMLPPDFSNLNQLIYAMFETIEIAFLGTFIAIVLSIPLGLFSARNLAPNYFVYLICKTIIIFFRAIPEFIIAMILVIAIGFGAMPGVLALGLHTMGFLAKFYAEDIEHINKGPIDALKSSGATKSQIISFGVIPQILPSFVANNLYILDRNVRMATMLGIVGAGGIGYELQSSFRMFEYERVSAIIILIFVTIFLIDHFSAFIRSKIK
ncbi:phosphonate ABC transporter, permease protein PhnE [Pelagibacteraceae bacterium]|nr:phosphonate ABC transporter, permease protein PhnE [Pelagibacteraceae bacterium]